MYQPAHFRDDDRQRQEALIRENPFGLLITSGTSGLMANGVPFILDPSVGEHGVLRAHVAKANTQWRELPLDSEDRLDVLVVFQGVDHYISPGWYETKRETGKVVPTWNYAMVQVKGRARATQDTAWLRQQIGALTDRMEQPRAEPWAVDDAPEDFIAAQMKGIVGIEIEITAIMGKWKASQNRNEADRNGVIAGLRAEGDARADAMAALVEESNKAK